MTHQKFATPALLLALAHLLAPAAEAQIERALEFEYRTSGLPVQRPAALIETPDGGVLAVNVGSPTTALSPPADVLLGLARYSRDGDLVWSSARVVRAFHGEGGEFNVSADVDPWGNTYVVHRTLSECRLLKFDPAGALLFDLGLPNSATFTPAGVAVDSQGRPVIGGTRSAPIAPRVVLYGLDIDGTVRYQVGGIEWGEMIGVEMGPRDEVALYGRTDSPGFGNYFGVVFLFDAESGARLWRRVVTADGYATLNFGTYWNDTVEDVEFDAVGNLYAFTNGDFGSEWFQDGWTGFALEGITLHSSTISSRFQRSPPLGAPSPGGGPVAVLHRAAMQTAAAHSSLGGCRGKARGRRHRGCCRAFLGSLRPPSSVTCHLSPVT